MELTELNISGSIAQKNSFIITDIFFFFFFKQNLKEEATTIHFYQVWGKKKKKIYPIKRLTKQRGFCDI